MTPELWRGKTVLVTGGTGFLGGAIVRRLRELGDVQVRGLSKAVCDLREPERVLEFLREQQFDAIIHAAGTVGGLFDNMERPAAFFYDNLMMGMNLLEGWRQTQAGKLVLVGSSCMYPATCWEPYTPTRLWDGPPAEGNAAYGIAKRVVCAAGAIYHQAYGRPVVSLVLPNLYGPGDDFDPATAHFVAALVARMTAARDINEPSMKMKGTGRAMRELMFIDDAVEAVLAGAENYDQAEPLNMGTGREFSVAEVAQIVKFAVGYEGELEWSGVAAEDGQARKLMNSAWAYQLSTWRPQVGMLEGIKKTVEWYTKKRALVF